MINFFSSEYVSMFLSGEVTVLQSAFLRNTPFQWTKLKSFLFVLFFLVQSLSASEIFVSPTGKPEAAGTRKDPKDLHTVLVGGGGVQPGDTVWLLPGVYKRNLDNRGIGFRSKLEGTPGKQITVRAEPGQRVTIDSTFAILGSYTTFWGFESTTSDFRTQASGSVKGRHPPIEINGHNIKLINIHVHDGPVAIGFWMPARDSEMYGCIVNDFGWPGKVNGRGNGHALYVQNDTGEKRIIDNIMFRGYGFNLHAYAEKGYVKGLHIEGNISFSAGQKMKGQVVDDILVSAYTPADRIKVISNFTYQPPGEAGRGGAWRPSVRLDSYGNRSNGSCEIRNNVIAGARGLQLGLWKNAIITGNKIWGPDILATLKATQENLKNYEWDSNTYIHTGQVSPFVLPKEFLFLQSLRNFTFKDWKKMTGFDKNSKWIEEPRKIPSGTWVYVRPNKYEPGRGHVAVYNWDSRKEVEVDISSIAGFGKKFEIRNVQDDLYGSPLIARVFDGKPVKVPTKQSEIAPNFEAYLVTSPP